MDSKESSSDLPDELGEQRAAFPNDSSGSGFLLLTPAEVQTIVHLPFLMQNGLLLLHFTNALLLRLV